MMAMHQSIHSRVSINNMVNTNNGVKNKSQKKNIYFLKPDEAFAEVM
jgi:hypothetical protein